MDAAKLRAWWSHRQGLDGSLAGKPAGEILARTGWARSVGGAGPYLTLSSRGGIGRAAADQAAAHLEIHELPAARGCTYVVPAADYALALKVGQGFDSDMRAARKLGVTDAEVDALGAAIVKALGKGPLDPNQLREAVDGAARTLGPEGVRKGMAGTLPLALGRLQGAGEIRRVPLDGRLDRQRYRYTVWKPNPLVGFRLSTEQAHAELARRFFTWIGPARPVEFQWFSGLGVKAAKAALEPLGLVPLEDGLLMFPAGREEFERFQPPSKPQYALVSSLDGLAHLRRDLASLIGPGDAGKAVFGDKGAVAVDSLADLPSHGIFDRGRLVGVWEYDPDAGSIAWHSFEPPDQALDYAVARMEAYVRDELGDARSFSLDSPRSRAPRIAALREASPG